jgi:hypothetical protein
MTGKRFSGTPSRSMLSASLGKGDLKKAHVIT